ncbi:signal transduction histidine kinase/ligand-binding sensor domain-containing protein [Duganella sp. SG902]|uniref:sensor histidine kinase n=1 Tax=Duganella sp. SG902 TaxID=2587016 RepID=UPI00159D102E|nr:sensor histidine kinase [Duganella sp. SG902]NVM74445.1 signal transduction histidine kinase/ligand-binding sensor domain-containing protein [Duganella sp. SG902]
MKRWLLALLSCCLLPAMGLARAPLPAINLHHTSWTARDGAPPMVLSITQTPDGWLWLGGPTGLYRFDGIQFEQFAPANAPLLTRNVSLVNAMADGALWIGYRTGGAGLLRDGRIRNYGERDGLPRRAVWGIERDGDGRTWAATAKGMFYLENERWQAPAASWGLPDGWFKTLMRDRQGVLWAQGDGGVYFLRPGASQFARAAVDSGTGVLFNLPDGGVVSWDAARARFNLLAGPQARAPSWWSHLGDPTSLLFDRRGDLWVGLKDGLEYRTARGVSGTTPPHGLSGRAVGALFEDSEGNVWSATSNGIDRFRGGRLTRIALPERAIGGAIMADARGGAWIGPYHVSSTDDGPSAAAPLWPAGGEGWSDLVTGYTRTADGALWAASFGALRRVQGRDSRTVALPPAIAGVMVTGVLADRDDSLLVALRRHGLYRRQPGGDWEKVGNVGEVTTMARSDATGVWLGGYANQVLHADGGAWRGYGAAEGLNIGLVMALYPRGRHVWAGGDDGLALLEQDRFVKLCGADGENFDGISGIVELDNGDLWLNGLTALFRIPAAEIARFRQDHAYRPRYERIDQRDGLEGAAPRVSPSPSLVLSSDGWLWVVRSTGVFRLRPAAALPSAPARPVIIKTIGAPGEGRSALADVHFAAGRSALQIDYTVPALAMPEKLRFRYRLDEVDEEWQEAGARRSAFYSNLGAGDYHFRVMASDYNGQWSGRDSVLRFTIAPALTERWWFRALCAVLLLAMAYLAYRWHIQRLRRRMASRLRERVSERERIARELHDTLLQSVQGLILHVHAAVMRLPPMDATRQQLETALRQADDVVDEGRGRIRDLRGEEEIDTLNFADAVRVAAARLRPDAANPVRLSVRGTARELEPAMYQEALAILTEAVANAYRHAQAQHIDVELQYGTLEFRCVVRDDGRGLPADVVRDGGRQNHWGLRGMGERAARIQARLVLRSEQGGGTEWQLVLPAALAYTR